MAQPLKAKLATKYLRIAGLGPFSDSLSRFCTVISSQVTHVYLTVREVFLEMTFEILISSASAEQISLQMPAQQTCSCEGNDLCHAFLHLENYQECRKQPKGRNFWESGKISSCFSGQFTKRETRSVSFWVSMETLPPCQSTSELVFFHGYLSYAERVKISPGWSEETSNLKFFQDTEVLLNLLIDSLAQHELLWKRQLFKTLKVCLTAES